MLLRLLQWPALLPAPPVLAWRITPAGLLEWCGPEAPAAPDLAVEVDASNPALMAAQALGGQTPQVQIEGDAQLAGDVNWLLQNLRWGRTFGDVVFLLGALAIVTQVILGLVSGKPAQAEPRLQAKPARG